MIRKHYIKNNIRKLKIPSDIINSVAKVFCLICDKKPPKKNTNVLNNNNNNQSSTLYKKINEFIYSPLKGMNNVLNGKKNSMVGVFQHDGKTYEFRKISPKNVIVFIPEKE